MLWRKIQRASPVTFYKLQRAFCAKVNLSRTVQELTEVAKFVEVIATKPLQTAAQFEQLQSVRELIEKIGNNVREKAEDEVLKIKSVNYKVILGQVDALSQVVNSLMQQRTEDCVTELVNVEKYWSVFLNKRSRNLHRLQSETGLDWVGNDWPNLLLRGSKESVSKALQLVTNICNCTKVLSCGDSLPLIAGLKSSFINQLEADLGVEIFKSSSNRLCIFGAEEDISVAYDRLLERAKSIKLIDVGDKRRAMIGVAGDNINYIMDQSGATVHISEDGVLQIAGESHEIDNATRLVESLMSTIECFDLDLDLFPMIGNGAQHLKDMDSQFGVRSYTGDGCMIALEGDKAKRDAAIQYLNQQRKRIVTLDLKNGNSYTLVKSQAGSISSQTGCAISTGSRDFTDGKVRLFGTDQQMEMAKQLIESLPTQVDILKMGNFIGLAMGFRTNISNYSKASIHTDLKSGEVAIFGTDQEKGLALKSIQRYLKANDSCVQINFGVEAKVLRDDINAIAKKNRCFHYWEFDDDGSALLWVMGRKADVRKSDVEIDALLQKCHKVNVENWFGSALRDMRVIDSVKEKTGCQYYISEDNSSIIFVGSPQQCALSEKQIEEQKQLIFEFESPFPYPENQRIQNSFCDLDLLHLEDSTSCATFRDRSNPTRCFAYHPDLPHTIFQEHISAQANR